MAPHMVLVFEILSLTHEPSIRGEPASFWLFLWHLEPFPSPYSLLLILHLPSNLPDWLGLLFFYTHTYHIALLAQWYELLIFPHHFWCVDCDAQVVLTLSQDSTCPSLGDRKWFTGLAYYLTSLQAASRSFPGMPPLGCHCPKKDLLLIFSSGYSPSRSSSESLNLINPHATVFSSPAIIGLFGYP